MSDGKRIHAVIRPETPDDRNAIRELTALAFAGLRFSDGTEPLVIDALRDAGALVLSLVAVLDERVIGHVAFSELGPATQPGWFALGPVSVEPSLQRRGVGSQLIEGGLAILRERGAKGCALLGDHRYYHRFGFVVTPALAPPEYPAEHFQVARFGDASPEVPLVYHRAFSVGVGEDRPKG